MIDSADEVFLERLTWPEIEAAIQGGMRTAVVCAASSEQHGPHLPEATDALLDEAYAEGLARRSAKMGAAVLEAVVDSLYQSMLAQPDRAQTARDPVLGR